MAYTFKAVYPVGEGCPCVDKSCKVLAHFSSDELEYGKKPHTLETPWAVEIPEEYHSSRIRIADCYNCVYACVFVLGS